MTIQTKMRAVDREATQGRRIKDRARMCRERMKVSTRIKVSNRQMKKCHNKKPHKTSNKAPHNKPTPHKNCLPSSP